MPFQSQVSIFNGLSVNPNYTVKKLRSVPVTKAVHTFHHLLVKLTSNPAHLVVNYIFFPQYDEICYIICARTSATTAAEWQT